MAPKLNQPNVETITTKPIIETQCTSCSKYPLKNYKINFKEQEEQKIFKEFEELGYEIHKHNEHINITKYPKIITIWFDETYQSNDFITKKEHQLLHRLFEIWGWFDE